MFNWILRYAHWLHTRWPAGTVERLPQVDDEGRANVPGLIVVGDLKGIPLLKFAADSGARAIQQIEADPELRRLEQDTPDSGIVDVAIVGAGIAGMAAALAAQKGGLSFALIEATEAFSTLADFPRAKPIFAYPTSMEPAGDLKIAATVKEDLLAELRSQTAAAGIEPRIARVDHVKKQGGLFAIVIPGQEPLRARRVVVAIGRSGDFRRLGVEGEHLAKVYHRLHDPGDFAGKEVLVVGGGDSALETALALAQAGSRVTLSHRSTELSRPKPENLEDLHRLAGAPIPGGGGLVWLPGSVVQRIDTTEVVLKNREGEQRILPNDAVFAMVGRQAPLDFLRRSGVRIRGDWSWRRQVSLGLILLAALFVYHWKTDAGIPVKHWFQEAGLFPFNLAKPADPASLRGTLALSMGQPSFYYSLLYCGCVLFFGYRRIQRRPTPYIKRQTLTLALIQCLPLFLLPYLLLPWAGHQGWFSDGSTLKPLADALFPESPWAEHGREYWRSLGLILAWPLFFWNVFTAQPLISWLVISLVQTFVLIPLIVYRWGKGAYCGWICSCGALAETMGDAHRQQMPHGPRWNRLNMVGQGILALTFVLLGLRLAGWLLPADHWVNALYMGLLMGKKADWGSLGFPFTFFNYVWLVDLLLAGVLGVGLYWHFSGRIWCRFACPLAALMHIYARFSRFRILADKRKCVSCNLCTAVCHQGIDVMNFANKGRPMADPQCVRCSACVAACPTGVLQFGQVDPRTGEVLQLDRLNASPVQQREQH
ncbi:MAG: NAD(P)-binding domain-containing protein [Candidatus Latescibacteria bacterium]|nr:NAD(P)-binding domain-containing protein [Candidatus Latescibacterota bacterium]